MSPSHDHAAGDQRRAGQRPHDPGPSRGAGGPRPGALLRLQRHAGNRAVAGLLGTGAVVQRDCVARGDVAAVRELLRPAIDGVLTDLTRKPELDFGPALNLAVGKALTGHADAAQARRAEEQAGKVAGVRESVVVGGNAIEYDVPLAVLALDGLYRDASGLEGVTVSAGLRQTIRTLSADVAATITDVVLAAPFPGLSLNAVHRDVIVAGTAAGDATALLRLELEGTITELVELRSAFAAAADEEARAEAGGAIGHTARQALLLNKALLAATEGKGGTGPTPLDTAVESRAAEIDRLRQTAMDETSTAKELGDDVKLLGEQGASIRHGEAQGDQIEAMGGEEATTILPEEAMPEATDAAEQKWAGDLATRIKEQRDEVKSLRGKIVPEAPTYTLAEFAGVHKRWYAFQSKAQEEQDPSVRLALDLMGEPYKLMGMDIGNAAVAAEAGIARGMFMNMAVDILDKSLGGGSSTQFGGQIARQGPTRQAKVGGTAQAPEYDYGELYPAGSHAPGRSGEVGSRKDLAGTRASQTATGFSGVSVLPADLQPAAARGAGLTSGPDVPLVGMRKVDAQEGWSYLVSVFGGPARDMLVAREHKVVPPDVANYLLARQQQLRTLEQLHVPRVGGTSFKGRPVGGTPLGSTATRGGGVEAAGATATERYLGGELSPKAPDEVTGLQKTLTEQRAATGVRPGLGAPSSKPQDAVGLLIGDLRRYLDGFFGERQDLAWRLAAIFHIANEEHHVGAQLMKLLEAGTIADMITEAIKISAAMMALQMLGPLGAIAAAAYAGYLRSQGVSSVTALITIASFCHSAGDADSLTRARAWAYMARNVADDAAELFENMVTSPVTAGMHALAGKTPATPRELADGLAPLMKDPAARKALLADLDARIEKLQDAQAKSGTVDPELPGLLAFRDGLMGRSTPEGTKAADEALIGAQSDVRVEKLTGDRTRSKLDVAALQSAMGDLAAHVPVVENSALAGNAVHVRYNDAGGLRVEVGPKAQPEHVRRHVETVRALRRYEGVTGRMLRLVGKVRQLITGHPAYKTAGFEAKLEVQKLRSIITELEANKAAIEAKADRLTGGAKIDLSVEAAAIGKEIANLEGQVARHEANVDSYAAGRGFVAAEDTTPPSKGAETRAEALRARAVAAAPAARGALAAAVGPVGGKLVDLEYEIKTQESLARKINDRSTERGKQTEASLNKAAGKVNDALRYTALFDGAAYLEGYKAAKTAMEAAGYKFVKEGNAWAEPGRFGGQYRGINATFKTPDGLEFEVQFHTVESHAMKQETHPLYEEIRDPKTPKARKLELEDEQRRRWGTVPYPAGIPNPAGGP